MTEERIETLEKRVTTLEGLLADCMFQLDTVLSQPKSKGVAIPKAKGIAKQQPKGVAKPKATLQVSQTVKAIMEKLVVFLEESGAPQTREEILAALNTSVKGTRKALYAMSEHGVKYPRLKSGACWRTNPSKPVAITDFSFHRGWYPKPLHEGHKLPCVRYSKPRYGRGQVSSHRIYNGTRVQTTSV